MLGGTARPTADHENTSADPQTNFDSYRLQMPPDSPPVVDKDVPDVMPADSAPKQVLPRPEETPPEVGARNPAESFVWWQHRYPGRVFPYLCRSCGTTVQLRQRVTQTRRVCPGCGLAISRERIDRQIHEWEPQRIHLMSQRSGCAVLFLLLAASMSAAAGVSIVLFGI